MNLLRNISRIACLIVAFPFLTGTLGAQQFVPPEGEYVVQKDVITMPDGTVRRYVRTRKNIYLSTYDTKTKQWSVAKPQLKTGTNGVVPKNVEVKSALMRQFRTTGPANTFWVILSDGTLLWYPINPDG